MKWWICMTGCEIKSPLLFPNPAMLRFTLFGFPVLIHWMFWLNAALMGGALSASSPEQLRGLLGWMAAVFLSILIHELGTRSPCETAATGASASCCMPLADWRRAATICHVKRTCLSAPPGRFADSLWVSPWAGR
jgi:hypothetical protein